MNGQGKGAELLAADWRPPSGELLRDEQRGTSKPGLIDCRGRTVTVIGTPTFTTASAVTAEASALMCNSSTFSGSATGKRYEATANAVIHTVGGGASFFPGDVAGSTATGKQYV